MPNKTDLKAPDARHSLADRLPSSDEIASAADAAIAFAEAVDRDGSFPLSMPGGDTRHLAPAVCDLIIEMLGIVSTGRMVTLASYDTMLTTQEAADLLNVSRPHLVKLLKAGDIPHEMVGTHRRVPLPDLISYHAGRKRRQSDALQELADLGQELDRA